MLQFSQGVGKNGMDNDVVIRIKGFFEKERSFKKEEAVFREKEYRCIK